MARCLDAAGWRIYVQFERWRVYCPRCRAVFVEHLDWLAKNPRYTKGFARRVGYLCREMTNKAVADSELLHHSTVKDLDKLYMQEQVEKAGVPAPRAIGVDEIYIRKGQFRVVVSDLERGRPIWVGGTGHKEVDLDAFFTFLGAKKSKKIKLAVMDMWVPFRNSVKRNVPEAKIIYDKFHIMQQLSKAMDEVRRQEYKRLLGKDRSFLKGQRYTLLSRRENLTLSGRQSLKKLLSLNKRLNKAYLLKESFGQLWEYKRAGWALAFFKKWKEALKWQRLAPYEKFAKMIERHWSGLMAYCEEENKPPMGMVEGLNNKIKVLMRKAYGYRDDEYLYLKIVASFLPPLPRHCT